MKKSVCFIFPFMFIIAILLASCNLPFLQSGTPVPTPQCIEPSIKLGDAKFRVDSISREADTFPEIPKRNGDTAFWVEGTTVNYVFGLSSTKDNLALDTILKTDDPIVIAWADCSTDEYVVSSVDTAEASDLNIFDQSSGGVTVYVQGESGTLVIHGERPTVQSADTLEPLSEDAPQIDLQILEFTQPDDQTLSFRIMITNQGAETITLTDKDVALISSDGSETPPLTMTPDLPQELRPGDIIPLVMTFSKPQGTSAILRIFDITFEEYFQ
jgi:hypothetical protein